MSRMRESWGEAETTTPAAPAATIKPDSFSNLLTNPWPSSWDHETGPTSYLLAHTQCPNSLADEEERELATALAQVVVTLVCIAVTAFAAGYAAGTYL